VFADSELVVKQVRGEYRVKNAGLKPLFVRALALLREFDSFSITHVRREENAAADAMANEAMDAGGVVGNPVCSPGGGTGQEALF
jgi:ribonuclease HI